MAEETVVAKLDVRADASQAQQQLNQLASAIDNVNKRAGATKTAATGMAASKREVAAAADTATKSVDAFGSAVGKLGTFTASLGILAALKSSMIDFNSTLEQSQVAFSTMSGSSERATRHLEELRKFAVATPFEFGDLLKASKQLQAYGTEIEQVIPTMEMLGNISAGLGEDTLPRLIMAYGQAGAAGRLMGGELRQFTEAGVPLLQALASTLGKTEGEIKAMSEAGQISFGDVQRALYSLQAEGGRFENLMDKQSKTFAGAMSNIKDSYTQMGAEIAESSFEMVRDIAVNLAEALTKWRVVFAQLQGIVEITFLQVRASILDVTDMFEPLIVAAADAAYEIAKKFDGLGEKIRAAFLSQFPGAEAAVDLLGGAADVGAQALIPGYGILKALTARGAQQAAERETPTYGPSLTTAQRAHLDVQNKVEEATARVNAEIEKLNSRAEKTAFNFDNKFTPAMKSAQKAVEATVEELLAMDAALKAAMPMVEEFVAAGDLATAAYALVALGRSNQQAVSEVLRIQEEQARKAEQALKDAADRAKEARNAFLDLANVMSNQLQKAFDALAGASQRSAGTILNLINLAAKGMGSAVASALGIPVSATIHTPAGGGGAPGPYAGPGGPLTGGGDQGFGAGIAGIFSRLGIGLGAWKQGAAGEGAAAGITSGFSLAAALGKAGAGLDDISAAIAGARTSIEDLGHWMGENLTGAAKDAAGSLIEAYDGLLRLAAEAEGDADKLAKLSQAADLLANAQKDLIAATKAAEEAKKADLAAQRAEAVRVGEGITQANQFRLGITTPRGPGGFQGTAPGGRDEYGNFFTPGVQSVWMGSYWEMKYATAEEQYQSWMKARFGLTRSEMELENSNWAMHEATLRRTKLLEMENAAMVRRSLEAQQYQRSMEERIRTAYGITQEQLYGTDTVAIGGDLRNTLAQLVLIMQRGINAYIEPNHAADKLGAALDQRSALLAGAGGYGPGVF